jgi:hypothetical protein
MTGLPVEAGKPNERRAVGVNPLPRASLLNRHLHA